MEPEGMANIYVRAGRCCISEVLIYRSVNSLYKLRYTTKGLPLNYPFGDALIYNKLKRNVGFKQILAQPR